MHHRADKAANKLPTTVRKKWRWWPERLCGNTPPAGAVLLSSAAIHNPAKKVVKLTGLANKRGWNQCSGTMIIIS